MINWYKLRSGCKICISTSIMHYTLNECKLRHFNKFKDISEKYVSEIYVNLFMKSYEKYKEYVYPMNKRLYRRFSDTDKSIKFL